MTELLVPKRHATFLFGQGSAGFEVAAGLALSGELGLYIKRPGGP